MAGTVLGEMGKHWPRQEKTRRDGQEWINHAMDQHKGALGRRPGEVLLGSAGCSRARQAGGGRE